MFASSLPQICAHRGVSACCPENTRVAFEAAVACGANAVECDLQLTADGQVVVWHNPQLDLCGRPDLVIARSTLQELRAADVGSWYGRRFAGERIMTLPEVLDEFGQRIPLLLELKTKDHTAEEARQLTSRVQQLLATRPALLSVHLLCFDDTVLHIVAGQQPTAKLVWNTNTPQAMTQNQLDGFPPLSAIAARIGELDVACSALIQDQGHPLWSFTCNSRDDVLKARRLGVQMMITDDPQATHRLLFADTPSPVPSEAACDRNE